MNTLKSVYMYTIFLCCSANLSMQMLFFYVYTYIHIYSDGMGRTGVFITVMSEIERIKFDGEIDIFQTIKAIRVQRPNMVSTGEQYKLCFEIIKEYLQSFDNYANFKPVWDSHD